MQNMPIPIPAPATEDKALNKVFNNLNREYGELATKRRERTLFWKQLHERQQNSKSKVDELSAVVQMQELEIATLEAEIPLMERVPEYLNAGNDLRKRERAIAEQTVLLAEQAVIAEFQKTYDPQRWPVRPAALQGFVGNHPIVLGARDRCEEMTASNPEREALSVVANTTADAKARLTMLRKSLDAKKVELAERQEEKRLADALQQKSHDDQLQHSHNLQRQAAKAADEARKRQGV